MFINPIMLAGLGAAALPLVLHLLSRARCRTVDFSGIMFLDSAEGHQQQSPQLKQAALLAMRIGMIVLLSLALARPVISAKWWGGGTAGKTSAVILVDASASMAFDENGRSRVDLARESVLQILSTLRRGDQASMLILGNSASGDDRFTSDLQSLALKAAELTPGSGQTEVASSLESAANLLDSADAKSTPLHRIYLVCDRQARNWRQVTEAFARTRRAKIARSGADTQLIVVPVGGLSKENIGIDSVELLNAPAIVGQPAEIEINVHNYGEARRDAVQVSCQIDSTPIAAAAVNLAPGQSQPVRLRVQFDKSGSQTALIEMKGAGVTTDPRVTYAVDVIDPIEVLIVSGREQKGGLRNESDYFRLALEPFQNAPRTKSTNVAHVKIVPSEAWNATTDLAAARVLVLANVPHLTPSQVQAVEQFIFAGGGLCIAPGNLVRAEDYNQSLYRDGSGTLPAILSAPTPADASATNLLGLDLNHPIFRFLKGRPDPIPSASIWRYFPTIVAPDQARVLASYASGKPFLIEKQFGRGRVILMTTALDMDWSSLPLSSFYLPFAQSMVRFLAAGEVEDRNRILGEPIVLHIDEPLDESAVQVKTPDGKLESAGLTVSRAGSRSEIRFDKTTIAGDYTLSLKTAHGPRVLHYAVRSPLSESDLTPLSREEWVSYQQRLSFQVAENLGEGLGTQLHAGASSRELWPFLLMAVIGLILLELAATRAWTRTALPTVLPRGTR